RTELAGGDKVLIDAVMTRIAATSILDGQRERLMFLVLLDRHRACWRAQSRGQRVHPRAIGKEGLVPGVALEQAEHDFARRPATLDDLHELSERDQPFQPMFELF